MEVAASVWHQVSSYLGRRAKPEGLVTRCVHGIIVRSRRTSHDLAPAQWCDVRERCLAWSHAMTADADRHLALRTARAAKRHHQPGPARGRLPGLDARQVQEPGRPPGSARRPDPRQARADRGLARGSPRTHGGDVEQEPGRGFRPASRRGRAWRIGDPDVKATLGHVASARLTDDVATPTARQPTPSARPPATASGSASSGRTPAAAWGRCSWRSTPS